MKTLSKKKDLKSIKKRLDLSEGLIIGVFHRGLGGATAPSWGQGKPSFRAKKLYFQGKKPLDY